MISRKSYTEGGFAEFLLENRQTVYLLQWLDEEDFMVMAVMYNELLHLPHIRSLPSDVLSKAIQYRIIQKYRLAYMNKGYIQTSALRNAVTITTRPEPDESFKTHLE